MASGRPPDPTPHPSTATITTPKPTGVTHIQVPPTNTQPSATNDAPQAPVTGNQQLSSPRALKKSFLSVVAGEKPPVIPPSREPGVYKDRPAVTFFEDEIQILASPFSHSIVGKFSKMPKMQEIRQAFKGIGLSGAYEIRWLDYKHVMIHLSNEQDFARIWVKQQWFISNQKMRVFKWSPEFEAEKESATVPVWISLPNLRAHLYEKSALLLIAKTVGKPLFVDEATANGSRPSVARVCVEYDCRKPPLEEVWIVIRNRETGTVTGGYSQKVEFSKMPNYCTHCCHVGHHVSDCLIVGNKSNIKNWSAKKNEELPQQPDKIVAQGEKRNIGERSLDNGEEVASFVEKRKTMENKKIPGPEEPVKQLLQPVSKAGTSGVKDRHGKERDLEKSTDELITAAPNSLHVDPEALQVRRKSTVILVNRFETLGDKEQVMQAEKEQTMQNGQNIATENQKTATVDARKIVAVDGQNTATADEHFAPIPVNAGQLEDEDEVQNRNGEQGMECRSSERERKENNSCEPIGKGLERERETMEIVGMNRKKGNKDNSQEIGEQSVPAGKLKAHDHANHAPQAEGGAAISPFRENTGKSKQGMMGQRGNICSEEAEKAVDNSGKVQVVEGDAQTSLHEFGMLEQTRNNVGERKRTEQTRNDPLEGPALHGNGQQLPICECPRGERVAIGQPVGTQQAEASEAAGDEDLHVHGEHSLTREPENQAEGIYENKPSERKGKNKKKKKKLHKPADGTAEPRMHVAGKKSLKNIAVDQEPPAHATEKFKKVQEGEREVQMQEISIVGEKELSEQTENVEREIPARNGNEQMLPANGNPRRKGARTYQRVDSQQVDALEPADNSEGREPADGPKKNNTNNDKEIVHGSTEKPANCEVPRGKADKTDQQSIEGNVRERNVNLSNLTWSVAEQANEGAKSNNKEMISQPPDQAAVGHRPSTHHISSDHDQWYPANSATDIKNKELTLSAAGDGMGTHKAKCKDTEENSKKYFSKASKRADPPSQGKHQQKIASGPEEQNVSVDNLEGSGEYSPIGSQSTSQSKGPAANIRIYALESSLERTTYHSDNPPTQESASGKCKFNKELSDVLLASGTNYTDPKVLSRETPLASSFNSVEIEVHPRVRCRRHSDTEASIRKIFTLASEEAVDIGENDGFSDDDSVSMSFAAKIRNF